ncbi:MAG: GIY-YIG nuclease family protein [Candidatus Liptonbacteria bacterium]|nr:GIY-YIG nuclease family protein [Candidatus Liptonbacteria bacterium]
MFYAYVLKSLSHGTMYIGSAENPEKRLIEEHNKGGVRYTKGRTPWLIIHKEGFKTRGEAMSREKFLKSGRGRKLLDQIISNQ